MRTISKMKDNLKNHYFIVGTILLNESWQVCVICPVKMNKIDTKSVKWTAFRKYCLCLHI